tara:strand:- start:1593 stop:3539 length:1947 start_codon:yes stop_codon:yes gene_type:complete
MCSIFGCLNYNNYLSSKEFIKSNNSMINRGPDYSEVKEYIIEDKILRFGFNRLSILDLSDNGNQPMLSSCQRYALIFNGEIYNHLELRKDEKLLNNTWKGTSDSETLINLFQHYDLEKILNKLEGMFAFAVFDIKEKKLFLARDRSGEKPIYFSTGINYFAFSSDLSAFTNLPFFKRKISKNALKNFISYNYISNPLSIYENTYKLPPSSFLVIDLNKVKLIETNTFNNFINDQSVVFKKWWSIRNPTSFNFEKNNYYKNTEKILLESVKNRLISDVPLGAFLSGGIDSSLVVALMQKLQNNTKTFTIGYENIDFDESKHAEKIANYLETDHTTYILSKKDFLDVIKNINEVYSEPFADSSQIPTVLLSKLSRQKVKVVLTGDGGDELFGGYNRYLYANKYFKIINFLSNFFGFNLFKILPYKQIIAILNIFLSNKFNQNQLYKIYNKLIYINDKKSFYDSITREWPRNLSVLNNDINRLEDNRFDNLFKDNNLPFEELMMTADFESYLTDDILCKVDRASMYSSLEARTPFLNHKLIEYSKTIPFSYKINNGDTKKILKSILSNHLPEKHFSRPKAGFAIPISEWMQKDLKDWVNDILSSEVCNKHNFFDYKIIQKLKNEHFSGESNHEHKLWSLIQFNNWYLKNIS